MHKMRHQAYLGLLLTLILLAACQPDREYPDRPIILICPWAAGGGTDRISRQIAPFLEKELGVPVNVVNATGGAGVTGHSRGARARPDGHTLTMMTVEINMLHWRKLTQISWTDFTPVGMINRDPAALFVRRDQVWHDLESLTASIKKQPGTLKASGTATGGIWHLALAGWLSAAGLKVDSVRWIPMNGAGPSLQELLSGGLDLVCCSLPEARTLLEAGEIHCLGVMSEERVEGYVGVPTFRESGVDWSIGGWRGIGLPRNTPAVITHRVAEALEFVVTGKTRVGQNTFPELMAPQGFDVTYADPSSFQKLLAQTDRDLGAILVGEDFSHLSVGPVGSMKFPAILFSVLGLILLTLIFRRIRRPGDSGKASRLSPSGFLHAVEAILCVILFISFAESIGFVLAGGFIMVFLLWRLGTRLITSVLVTLILVPLVYQLFANVLRVPLSRGLLGW
jgi:tripartite-type tricarboxylate transporter receptor subunit TctC